MKKLIQIYLGVLTLTMVSCEILDEEPVSSFSAQGFYQTASDAQAGVYGIYDGLQSTLSRNFAFWGEGRGDAVNTSHSGDPLALMQNNLNTTLNSASWNTLYETISRANYAIKYVPQVFNGESENGQQLLGQARALRALCYFYAVRVWGDVPLVTEPYESIDQDIFIEKTDRELVLDQVVEDLLFASENCRATFGGERDRILFTQGGADALLTHVYMWRHEYALAIETADRVLNNSLYSLVTISEWSSIFTTGLSRETIFEIGYNETQTNFLRVLYALGSDSDYFPSEDFMDSFEEGDERQTLIYDVTLEQPRQIWKFFGKGFSDESADPSQNNIVLLRLADIMLLKAEAHANLIETDASNVDEALSLLNTIRTRAGLDELTQSDAETLYGDIESAILHERSIELSYEGHRWFDLVRNNKAVEVMGPLNGLSDELNLVWPIHQDAINRNPNLLQNDFYR
ncbi:RagB/SusD family nutrient uptake outer membrane protein [Marinoscillum furvescens]|uniref:Putative outer membrane starch-binding protein n=1 Tax=Marinoscillum furvescens DSM 4134 TaxID=1122208 RepID=A0A3D9LGP3_MARFU|nr:RagB/SusD family nutrient uptake outer membrane protein [Marinoscillum furvescens]REE05870.1 putative outer membrane starch-binding protein [Marinoscillum furvescens DSM 4134]